MKSYVKSVLNCTVNTQMRFPKKIKRTIHISTFLQERFGFLVSLSLSLSLPMTDICEAWNKKISRCKARHGDRSERCAIPELEQKRCLAFRHCPETALVYYGTATEEKAWCASFEESYCFGNPRIMNVDSANESSKKTKIFEHHQKAKRKMVNNRQRFRDCKTASERLHRCLRKHGIGTNQ